MPIGRILYLMIILDVQPQSNLCNVHGLDLFWNTHIILGLTFKHFKLKLVYSLESMGWMLQKIYNIYICI